MSHESNRRQPEPIDPKGAHRLAEQIGEFILEFSEFEGMFAYDVATLMLQSSNGDDLGRILNSTVGYGAKVRLFDLLCNHLGYQIVDHEFKEATYELDELVSDLRRVGSTRNRLVHDEMWPSKTFEVAGRVRLKRTGDPHDDGWLTSVYPEDIAAARGAVKKAKDSLVKFMLAVHHDMRQKKKTK